MKLALVKVVGGSAIGVFVTWYIVSKTDYWWASLLFIVVLIIGVVRGFRQGGSR